MGGGQGPPGLGDFEPVGFRQPKSRRDLLFQAIQERDFGTFQDLLDLGVDVNKRNRQKCTLLYSASLIGDYKMVRALLEKGADVNALSFGKTPLMVAASSIRPDPKIIDILLARGADPTIKNPDGKMVTDFPEWESLTEKLKLWQVRKKQETQLLRKDEIADIISELNNDMRKTD
ncbi:MAG: ankyrin repeat domain-containing protein [Candidatus Micrarchaeota archaeon]|nr:ankyrin repeat domain-containing protein [Candidatus Micrarchaeota archaeon]